ncbi:MAG: Sir2 histone deacetylase Hst2 [Claussenomyces sp. TS43310]|nr:MAG: Sir2 histone deacetylase Hst2 [Claussenomyces sp. TS43310]
MGQESSHELLDESVRPQTLQSRTINSVAELIKDGKAKKIVVMTGAGISTSAGIPDFRSPETGLYANLARLELPYPEAVFDLSYFKNNPRPFYTLARELYPGIYKPTIAHAFIALLNEKGLLRMLFTQNIDCLERAAGVPADKIVEAHGSFASQRCIECKTDFPDDKMMEAVMDGRVPHCQVEACNGLVKPDIVFFGEQLPEAFFKNRTVPSEADLVIIMGTSLSVQPFASLPTFTSEGVPRVLLNLERVGDLGSRPDDVCLIGDCDMGVRKLADSLGWTAELETLWKEVGGKPDEIKEISSKSKDEALEDEIEKITSEVDHTLKLSHSHYEWLEKHLQDKSAKATLPKSDTSITGDVEPTAATSSSPQISHRDAGETSTSPEPSTPPETSSSTGLSTASETPATESTSLSGEKEEAEKKESHI